MTFWDSLSNFVKKVCEGRDSSHGHEHMKSVAGTALYIYDQLQYIEEYKQFYTNKSYKNIVMVVAWLHDVSDHKYDPEHKLNVQINNFLNEFLSEEDIHLIFDIIDRISYSKEANSIKKGIPLDWEDVLGEDGCFIRDIVSDADKLEAIGSVGIKRCMEYQRHYFKEKYGTEISYKKLVTKVKEHADEKLLKLKDNFIRTKVGKDLAKEPHDKMVEELNRL